MTQPTVGEAPNANNNNNDDDSEEENEEVSLSMKKILH